jgi:predicted 3-demethylubiquinone-9 3-methyltransferase (glyoxalase superfamily)
MIDGKNFISNKALLRLWYEDHAERAAEFYAATFPISHFGAIHRAPGQGDLTGTVQL